MAKVPTASLVVPWRELHSMAWFWLQEEREVEFSDDLLVFLFYFILFFFFSFFLSLLPSPFQAHTPGRSAVRGI